jgi:glyoxylase I family protein
MHVFPLLMPTAPRVTIARPDFPRNAAVCRRDFLDRYQERDMLFTPLGLDHIVLRVQDQETTQKFYVERLCCQVERVNPEISLIQLRFGEHLIDLVPGRRSDDGLEHYCLSIRCGDLVALADEFRAAGILVELDIEPRTGAWGRSPSFFIRDPEGYLIELKPR